MLRFFLLFCLLAATTVVAAAESYKYGRFTVNVSDDGSQDIVGGVFTPTVMPLPGLARLGHVIFVDYTTKELSYFRYNDATGSYEPVIGYAVVTPDPEFLPSDVVQGIVRKIDTRPTWCPGPQALVKYPDLRVHRGCVPFGHKDNAMGVAKFEMIWWVDRTLKEVWSSIKVHAASQYPKGKFWEEESLGCVRLLNAAMEELLSLLGPEVVADPALEGVQVILMRGGDDELSPLENENYVTR